MDSALLKSLILMENFDLARSLLGCALADTARRLRVDHLHRGHGVLALFAVELRDSQEQLVFLDPELRAFAHRQQYRMLLFARTNAVHHSIGLQHIFLAQHLALFLVRSIRAKDLSGNALAAVFVNSARHRVHVRDGAGLAENWLILREDESAEHE